MQPAVAAEALNQGNPADDKEHPVKPYSRIERRPRTEPPESQQKSQPAVSFA